MLHPVYHWINRKVLIELNGSSRCKYWMKKWNKFRHQIIFLLSKYKWDIWSWVMKQPLEALGKEQGKSTLWKVHWKQEIPKLQSVKIVLQECWMLLWSLKFHFLSKKLSSTTSHNPSLQTFKQKKKNKSLQHFCTLFEALTVTSKWFPRHHAAL